MKVDVMISKLIKDGLSEEEATKKVNEDMKEIARLEEQYARECESITEECAEEGYPSHGSNYELRCENARRYYDEQIELIECSYEEDANECHDEDYDEEYDEDGDQTWEEYWAQFDEDDWDYSGEDTEPLPESFIKDNPAICKD